MEDRSKLYAEKLGVLIRKETISSYGQTDITKFEEFHQILFDMFPSLFKASDTEDFSGSLLIRWKGKSSENPIMMMNHHDVVDGEGKWKYPPFSGEIHDGKLWGRGALDTKGGLFCMLQAAEELAASGFIPEHDIYFESACTEEVEGSGAEKIARVLKERGIHFRYTLDEGGMILHDPIGGADGDFAMIGVGEKNSVNIDIIARSNGGHASMPGKNTPLVRIGKFITDVEKSNIFRKKLNSETKEMFRRMSVKMKWPLKAVLGHPDFFSPLLKAVLPAFSPAASAMMRTTAAFTQAGGADSVNSLPQKAYVTINMRTAHHQRDKESIAALKKLADRYNLEVEVTDPGFESELSGYKTEEFRLLEETVKTVFPGVLPSPYITNTASDSRFFDCVSDGCYRFTPFFITDQQLDSIHGLDENVDISSLPKAVDFYKILMEKTEKKTEEKN